MLETIILTKRKYNMTFNLLNPTTHTEHLSFDSIPEIITYLKTLNLPSTEQYLIFKCALCAFFYVHPIRNMLDY